MTYTLDELKAIATGPGGSDEVIRQVIDYAYTMGQRDQLGEYIKRASEPKP